MSENATKIIPGIKRVLILRDEVEHIENKKLVIPDSVKRKNNTGVIVEVSPDCQIAEKGMKVHFPMRGSGINVEIEEKEYLLIREEDCLIFIKE